MGYLLYCCNLYMQPSRAINAGLMQWLDFSVVYVHTLYALKICGTCNLYCLFIWMDYYAKAQLGKSKRVNVVVNVLHR